MINRAGIMVVESRYLDLLLERMRILGSLDIGGTPHYCRERRRLQREGLAEIDEKLEGIERELEEGGK